MTDPAGRLADLARHIRSECIGIITDIEGGQADDRCDNLLTVRAHAVDLITAAQKVEQRYDGYTEMPDARNERLALHTLAIHQAP